MNANPAIAAAARGISPVLCALAVLAAFALAASTQAASPWNPAQAREIAAELAGILEKIDEAQHAVPEGLTASGLRARAEVLRVVLQLKRDSSELSSQLAAGETREQTQDRVRQIRALRDAAASDGTRSRASKETMLLLVQAEKLLSALEQQYDPPLGNRTHDPGGKSVSAASFFGARNEPPAGRVLHGWGQFSTAWVLGESAGEGDVADLAAYEAAVRSTRPAMLSFYVAPVAEQVGLFLERYGELVRSRPFVAQIGLYFQSLQAGVARGDHDDELRQLAEGLRDLGHPVLLRVGYEFNNPWALYDPKSYRRSFRRIVGIFREAGATRVAAVWNASSLGLEGRSPRSWYPGDDWVDWWSTNIFHFGELVAPETLAFLRDAQRHGKPILIGEAAPVLSSPTPGRVRGPHSEVEALRWLTLMGEFVARVPAIKAVSFLAVDFRRIPRWNPSPGWPDVRLSAWPGYAAAHRALLAEPRYVHASDLDSLSE